MSPFIRRSILTAAVGALALIAWGCSGGGCPWTQAQVSVSPATACLGASVLNANGESGWGGCVSPDVRVSNACAEPLVVDGVVLLTADGSGPDTGDGGAPTDGGRDALTAVTIAPGETKVFEVDHPGSESAAVPAKLGTQDITFELSLSKP